MNEPTNPEWQAMVNDLVAELSALGVDDAGNCFAVNPDGEQTSIGTSDPGAYTAFDFTNLRPDDLSALGSVWGNPEAVRWTQSVSARAWLARDRDDTMGIGFFAHRIPNTVMVGIADPTHVMCIGMSTESAERLMGTLAEAIAWAREHRDELQATWDTSVESDPVAKQHAVIELLAGRRGTYVLPGGRTVNLDVALDLMPRAVRNEFLRQRMGVEIVRRVRGEDHLNMRLAMVRAAETEEEFSGALVAIAMDASTCLAELTGPVSIDSDGTVTFLDGTDD